MTPRRELNPHQRLTDATGAMWVAAWGLFTLGVALCAWFFVEALSSQDLPEFWGAMFFFFCFTVPGGALLLFRSLLKERKISGVIGGLVISGAMALASSVLVFAALQIIQESPIAIASLLIMGAVLLISIVLITLLIKCIPALNALQHVNGLLGPRGFEPIAIHPTQPISQPAPPVAKMPTGESPDAASPQR